MGWGVACCPRCRYRLDEGELNIPLISTMAFAKAEFYCLDCGGKFGFMQPFGVEGEAIDAKLAEYQKEWDDNVGNNLIVTHSWLDKCDMCVLGDARHTHDQHATSGEWTAHEAALEWLRERMGTSVAQ